MEEKLETNLQQYLPNRKKTRPHQNMKLIQQQISRVKQLLNKFEKGQDTIEQQVIKQLQQAVSKENALLRVCQVEWNNQTKNQRDSQFSNQCQTITKTMEDIYIQQVQLTESFQQYLNKLSKQTGQLHQKLQSITLEQNLQHSHPKLKYQLPSAEQLHGQVLEEVGICQHGFNKMMEAAQDKLEKQIGNLGDIEGLMILELGAMLDSRISTHQVHQANLKISDN